jgi:C1A family cysteine protease
MPLHLTKTANPTGSLIGSNRQRHISLKNTITMRPNQLPQMRQAILDAGHSWEASPTFLHDLDDQTRRRYLGYVPSNNEPPLTAREDRSRQHLLAFRTNKVAGLLPPLPAQWDWRNKNGQNYITPVRDQGQCGSCVAFGACAVVEGMVNIAKGAGTNVDLSEAQLFYCVARSQGRLCEGPNGGWSLEPSQIAFRDIGVPDEACYPYIAGDQNCSNLCPDWETRVQKTTGYTTLNSADDIKNWVAGTGPLQTAFSVYSDFMNYYQSGVYHKTPSATLEGGHCVCIVGYDDTQECWICKNSWGPVWAKLGGYFLIGYGECGIDAQGFGANGIV